MPSPFRAEPSVLERMKELDHEHRKRLRGALPLTLSMRYLATALERLRAGTEAVRAVPVRRSGGRGFGGVARRGACGYVVRAQGTCVYFAGDTGYFSAFAEIGRRFHPDVALLPISGYEPASFREEHLSPLDALYA